MVEVGWVLLSCECAPCPSCLLLSSSHIALMRFAVAVVALREKQEPKPIKPPSMNTPWEVMHAFVPTRGVSSAAKAWTGASGCAIGKVRF